jgi:FAD binding domain
LSDAGILAGDTAHVHTAAGGQGMNTGMQDALNLGWKLALTVSGAASPSLLQTYESERLPNARNVLRVTKRYDFVQVPRGVVGRLLSGAIFKTVATIRPLGKALARVTGMLALNYQQSSLSQQDSRQRTRHTCAGWHVPDVPCRFNGYPTTVFEIVRGTFGHLMLFAGTTPKVATLSELRAVEQAVAPFEPHLKLHYVFASEFDADAAGIQANVITDGGQHLQVAFGIRGPEVIYVRPDGYIGLRTTKLDGPALLRYLRLIYASAGIVSERSSVALPNQIPATGAFLKAFSSSHGF